MPEFSTNFDDDEVYLMLFEFGQFLLQHINDAEVRGHCFDFINYALEAGGDNTEEAIVMQVFHGLYNDPKIAETAVAAMSLKAKTVFHKFFELYKNQ